MVQRVNSHYVIFICELWNYLNQGSVFSIVSYCANLRRKRHHVWNLRLSVGYLSGCSAWCYFSAIIAIQLFHKWQRRIYNLNFLLFISVNVVFFTHIVLISISPDSTLPRRKRFREQLKCSNKSQSVISRSRNCSSFGEHFLCRAGNLSIALSLSGISWPRGPPLRISTKDKLVIPRGKLKKQVLRHWAKNHSRRLPAARK